MPSFRSERKVRIIFLNGGRAHLWDLCFVSLFAGLFFFFPSAHLLSSFYLSVCEWIIIPPTLFVPFTVDVLFLSDLFSLDCFPTAIIMQEGDTFFHLIIIFFIMQISKLIMAQADKKKSL